jgi:hypothetical protein
MKFYTSVWKKREKFEFEFQTKPNRACISIQACNYMVGYHLGTVDAIVILGVSQPSPLTEISTRDLEGETVLTGAANSRTFPHYGNTKPGWRE